MSDLYQVCPKCHGGTCQHTTPCEGCLHSEYMGFVPVTIDYEAAERAIDLCEVFTASDGKPGIRIVERSQSEIARLAVDAAVGEGTDDGNPFPHGGNDFKNVKKTR